MKTERSVCKIVLLNTVSILSIIAFLVFGSRISHYLNIVENPLTASEVICWYQFGFGIFLSVLVGDSSGKTKTIRTKVARVFNTGGILFLSVLMFHSIAVLYGAPVTDSFSETFHFACLLSFTSVLPSVLAFGSSVDWIGVLTLGRSEDSIEFSVVLSGVFAVVGAWFGAFPIPLDWDRPWQIWPVSCLYGTLIGYLAGLTVGNVIMLTDRNPEKRKSKAV